MNLSDNASGHQQQQAQRKPANQNIQVYTRVRPLNSRERCMRSNEVVDVISPREIVTRQTFESKLTKKFTFDRSFGPESTQVEVYTTVVAPLIEEVLAGYNCTVFAYGQTGTGKTHTMVGTECAELRTSWDDNSEIGMIPRALSHLFDELRLMELEFSMRISYLELYNEELCDLLSSDDSVKIRIFDDTTKKGSIIVQGLEEIPVHSKDEVYKLLEKGKERRKTATTLMNAQSSRSHTVFSILVHIRENGIDGEELLKIGKLNLVDLAGSENVSKAGNEKGIRVRETVNINQSLLTLGRVITALVERTPHVPYRESKLTRLLQESLGGRTKTSIIATISPGHKDIEETLSTLEYAHRAKNIQNKPEVNQKLTKKVVLKEYTEEIDKLKRDLMAARDKNGIYLAEETYAEMTGKMDAQHRELNEKMLLVKALKDEMVHKEKIFSELSLSLIERDKQLRYTENHLTETKSNLQQTKKLLGNTKRRYNQKKVLLQSHMQTEQKLSTQAKELLSVADVAVNDTEQLHSNIERRKALDAEIQTATDRFSNQMIDHLHQMDDQVQKFDDKHKNHVQLLEDELNHGNSAQVELKGNVIKELQNMKQIIAQKMDELSGISQKYGSILKTLTGEQNSKLHELFNEMHDYGMKSQMNLFAGLDRLTKSYGVHLTQVSQSQSSMLELQRNTAAKFKAQLFEQQKLISNLINRNELQKLRIDEQQELLKKQDEEEALLKDIISKMEELKDMRQTAAVKMTNNITEWRNDHSANSMELFSLSNQIDQLLQTTDADTAEAAKSIKMHAEKELASVSQDAAICNLLKSQMSEYFDKVLNETNGLHAVTNEQHDSVVKVLEAERDEVCQLKHMQMEQLDKQCQQFEQISAKDIERTKTHIAVAASYGTSLQTMMQEFEKAYKVHVAHAIDDIAKFKTQDIKPYMPTGVTPAKRTFNYPRVLSATSPHGNILARYEETNDWSDLDTTGTIEEESDHEPSQLVADNSKNLILNSTPVDASNCKNINMKRGGSASGTGTGISDCRTLQPKQYLDVEQLNNITVETTALPKNRKSPNTSKMNKENQIN